MAATGKRPGPEARKKQIIDAGIGVFGRKGYNGATTAEIAENAGLSPRMLFFYFENKKELFRAVVKACAEDAVKGGLRGSPPLDDLRTSIKMGMRNYVEFLRSNPMKMRVLFLCFTSIEDPDIRKDMIEMAKAFYQVVYSFQEKAQGRGNNPEELILDRLTLNIMSFLLTATLAEFYRLPWYGEKGHFNFEVEDYFIDTVTKRQ